MELRIFQKGFNYSQDGPGNRLVYHLQGCNLRCPWCANPEGLSVEGGERYPVEALVQEVLRSRAMFFDGGGVTLTGGEVTLQFDALKELLTRLHAEGVSACIETNGCSPRLPELFGLLDTLIMDVKHYDPEIHRAVTGASCAQTFQNIRAALEAGQKLALRIPVIGGFNASAEDAEGFAQRLTELGVPGRATVELLAYHEYGKSKYEQLGLPYRMTEQARVNKEILQRLSQRLQQAGIQMIHT